MTTTVPAHTEVEIDPTTISTIWHSLQTSCREMRHMIERTAQSFLMAQLKDVSVGLWRADGATVAMPEGLPSQFLGTKFAIEDILERFGDDLHPGDVILTNDPFNGGHSPHLPDWGFIRPIFFEGELLFFTLVRGHVMDTGGSYPGGYFPNAYDIHAEGLCIPPTRVVAGGEERTDVFELIFNNVRYKDEMRIDCKSMIATTSFMETRVQQLLSRYGRDVVLSTIEQMMDRTENAIRAEIARIPDGTYQGEAATDDDGTVLDEPVWVRVDLTIDGEDMTIDFSRSDGQRPGFINRVYATTYGTAVASAILLFDPALADYHNEGSLRPIDVIVPKGTVTNARYPATVGGNPVALGTITMEAVTLALAKARPDRAMAGWGKHRGDYTNGQDPRTGRPYVRTTFDYDGSQGAVWGHDGWHGPTAMGTLGSVIRGNVEEAEIRFPWLITQIAAVPDFSGAGRWRGGCGIDWRATNEGSGGKMATGSSDGDAMLPAGVLGGASAPPSRTFLRRDGELIRVKPHRMQDFLPGDELIKLSSGGGGVGRPFDRDPEAVADDVRNGYVSAEAARTIYGVVIDDRTGTVDEAATSSLRDGPQPDIRIEVDEERLGIRLVTADSTLTDET
ncbi:hydantoinase B/oxoprolinase family protein [Nocardia sp. NPDC050408]|uniref:hydantoinase B/oxoprolinase family protein n=1 Tax=Nocardia sp. NPDC050408 TaxID=3364319 RepID=UPI003789E769